MYRVLHRIANSAGNGSMPNPVNRLLPLVNNTKSIHRKKEVIDPETGEIQRLTFNDRRREFVPDSDADSVNGLLPALCAPNPRDYNHGGRPCWLL